VFSTKLDDIEDIIDRIDTERYARSRNYENGAVTKLSPYISRGVISTKYVYNRLQEKGVDLEHAEKFIQELAWRDYWQEIWKAIGNEIDLDLKPTNHFNIHEDIPAALVNGKTGIEVVDKSIRELYNTGYVHNHMRMYLASIACNIGKYHWSAPAKWMYYHLLDGDWASNALSWQWVSGASRNKRYYANQDNINKYFNSNQKGTFLDRSYEQLEKMNIPELLNVSTPFEWETPLPASRLISIDHSIPTYIYNYYNLDPFWDEDINANRILLLEPSVFKKYPVAQKPIDFALKLSENIKDIQLFVGEFSELKNRYQLKDIVFKEHPLNDHYEGKMISRDTMFNVHGHFQSFFKFWKECKREVKAA
jgi:deoxyribodipyrimidine photo-lyase